ncbi:MAG: amino acid adenylation domain-containing protein [Candidatus Thiodiazotropha sp.]
MKYKAFQTQDTSSVSSITKKSVIDQFELQVKKAPQNVALIFNELQMSYQDLDDRARQLADYLLEIKGTWVDENPKIAICIDPGFEMVFGLLGILKAGGSYVPLQSNITKDLMVEIMEQNNINILLTHKTNIERLDNFSGEIINLNSVTDNINILNDEFISQYTSTQENVCVIYSSPDNAETLGSKKLSSKTIKHTKLYNVVNSIRQQINITSSDCMLAITPLSQDTAALEVFLPLTCGAKILFVSHEVASDTNLLTEKLNNQQVTILHANPVTWKLINAADWKSSPDLKIVCGGSVLSPYVARQVVLSVFEYPELSDLMIDDLSNLFIKPHDIQILADGQLIPLSFPQQRLWFLDQLFGSNSAVYNIPIALQLTGNVNEVALRDSFCQLVRRHDSLRMVFPNKEGNAVVEILPPYDPLEINNIVDNQEFDVHNITRDYALHTFNLEKGPLLRSQLLNLSDDKHLLLICMHHIVSDGWSLGVFIRELVTLYHAYEQGNDNPLQPLTIQYQDYAHWQHQCLTDEILQSEIDYWKNNLSGIPELLEIPADHPRPAQQSYQGHHIRKKVNKETTKHLNQVSQEYGASLFMTLLSAFNILLFRYTEQQVFCVGTPVANRKHPNTEDLIGFFINTLVLRADFSDIHSFKDALDYTRRTCLESYAHQELPYEILVEELHPNRNLSFNPIFQTMFILQNTPVEVVDLPGLKVNHVQIEGAVSRLDITVQAIETEDGLVFDWEYNTDIFDQWRIQQMAAHFTIVLNKLVDNVNQPVREFSLLSEIEKSHLDVWNDTTAKYPNEKNLVELFETQVKTTPNNVAVSFDNEQLNYHKLNENANRLANYLKQKGVGPEVMVGICMDRTLNMVVGLLGVLKAGGAYVPLDPAFPIDRLRYMLNDSAVPILLTQAHLSEHLPQVQATIICIDSDWHEIEKFENNNPDSELKANNLAYVIYTSGSTGQPKGIQIDHASLVNFLLSMAHKPGICQTDVLLAVTTLSFDISTLEIFLPLIVGAQIALVNRNTAQDGERLLEVLRSSNATIMQATPTTWRLLIESGWQSDLPLKVLCGGETLSEQLADQLLQRSSSVWNMYGPTEATVWTSIYELGSGNYEVAIGKPISNTQLHILDSQLNRVPIGVAGQLYIGGNGLARGYINKPNLSADNFIPNPFTASPGERLYKSGDLTRYLPDGNIEYLGRIDHQVKIRGFRIELGEIETRLLQHEAIQESVVTTTNCSGEMCLVAYIVSDKELESGELRSFLKSSLPDYMIPSHYVRIDAFPLTPNSKVDLKALPSPEGHVEQTKEYVSPQTNTEHALATIWSNLLNQKNIGIHDNFFERGGHSLLVIQLKNEIEKLLLVNIPVKELFNNPTIYELSIHIDRLDKYIDKEQSITQTNSDLTDNNVYPLSRTQKTSWFLRFYPTKSDWPPTVFAINISGKVDTDALEYALINIINKHDTLRTTFKIINGSPHQVINRNIQYNIEKISVENDLPQIHDARAIEKLIQENTDYNFEKGFDLEEGIFPYRLFIFSFHNSNLLVLSIDHIIFDAWSMQIFSKDLLEYYIMTINKTDIVLHDSSSYKEYLTSQSNNQNCYIDKSEGEVRTIRKPIFALDNHDHDLRYKEVNYFINKDHLPNLENKSSNRISNSTIFLASFFILLKKLTHISNIAIGVYYSDRSKYEISDIFGYFLNMIVVNINVTDEHHFVQKLDEHVMSIYDNVDCYYIDRYLDEPDKDKTIDAIFNYMPMHHHPHADKTKELIESLGLQTDAFSLFGDDTLDTNIKITVVENEGGANIEISCRNQILEGLCLDMNTIKQHFLDSIDFVANSAQDKD